MANIGKGLLAGLIATLVISLLMIVGADLWPQFGWIGLLADAAGGERATGWLIHGLIGTLFWGPLYAWLCPELPGDAHWVRGLAFAAAAWLLMMVLVMPALGAGLFAARLDLMVPISLVLHGIFGVVLGTVYGWLMSRNHSEARTALHVLA